MERDIESDIWDAEVETDAGEQLSTDFFTPVVPMTVTVVSLSSLASS